MNCVRYINSHLYFLNIMAGIVQSLQYLVHGNPGDRGLQSLFISSEEAAKRMAAAEKRKADLAIAEGNKGSMTDTAVEAPRSPSHLGNNIDVYA